MQADGLCPENEGGRGAARPLEWEKTKAMALTCSNSRRTGASPGHQWSRAILSAIAVIAGFTQAGSALSQSQSDRADFPVRHIKVVRFKSRTIQLLAPFTSAVVGSPEIADVLPMSDRVLYIQGKKSGTTNVSIFGAGKTVIGVLDVEVSADTQSIAEKIQSNTGSPGIRVSNSQEQIILSGEARNAVDAERALAIVKGFSPDSPVINLMRIAPAQQVMLKVRFLEASRSAERDLGVNLYSANKAGTSGINTGISALTPSAAPGLPLLQTVGTLTGGSGASPYITAIANLGGNVDILISALETKGLVRELAEPDLVALSGDTASFLAGGEVPVPVVQPSSGATPTITVDYKQFGIQLTFQPTVLSNGIINLRLSPSVSELDYANGIENQGFLIPALTKREARTTIELRDGQSFAIAGLLQTEGSRNISQVPWLGTVPILGSLFRSSAYQQKETDLVVIVTPHIVAPIAPGQRTASPLDSRLPSNDADFFLLGQTEVPKKYTDYVTSGGGLAGPYGHIVPLSDK
jgi:pilus assembly protein CpaC